MEPRVNLIRTTALRNETGLCLVNSFLRVVLNSDTLTTEYIERSHKTFGNKGIRTTLGKLGITGLITFQHLMMQFLH